MPSPLFSRALIVVLMLAVTQSMAVRGAQAHAVIITSVPAVGAIVRTDEGDVALHYNSRIDHQRSRLTLISPDGKGRPLVIAPDSAPDVVVAKMSDLGPGQYRLRWQVLAIDGHMTRGDIPFSVKAP